MSGCLALASDVDPITAEQLALGPQPACPRTAEEFRRAARWWELEASRGYGGTKQAAAYARNMYAAADAREADGTEQPWTPGVDVLHDPEAA